MIIIVAPMYCTNTGEYQEKDILETILPIEKALVKHNIIIHRMEVEIDINVIIADGGEVCTDAVWFVAENKNSPSFCFENLKFSIAKKYPGCYVKVYTDNKWIGDNIYTDNCDFELNDIETIQ